MESPSSPMKKQFRAVLPLLKAHVIDRGPDYFKLAIGGSTTITIACNMAMYDIRDGDLLTLYTEVLIRSQSNG
jgi:hypothetical protein